MNVVFLGPPGSGKGTQATRLAKAKGLVHLSTGDVLRAAVKAGTELGRKAEGYMSRGELVPDELIVGMIEEMVESGKLGNGFVLDGFPRTVAQAERLNATFHKHGIKIDRAVLFDVADTEILKRLKKRAELEGRNDDTEAVIKNRLEVYRRQTRPIEDIYRRQSILTEIEGEGTIEQVFDQIVKAVG